MMFSGSIVALVTPFTNDGKIDFAAIERLISWHIASGSKGILVNGSTGENVVLSEQEQQDLIRFAVKNAANKIPIIAGTGNCSTYKTIKQSRIAEQLGVDACLVVCPYYNKPTQQGLRLHFTEVARSCGLPIILYNNPARTNVDLQVDTITELNEIDNIIGIKETSSDPDKIQQLRESCGSYFAILCGDDLLALDYLQNSAQGIISVAANIIPTLMQNLCNYFKQDRLRAVELQSQLRPLLIALTCESNPIPIKYALARLNKINNVLRLPLTMASSIARSILDDAMTEINLEVLCTE